MKKQKTIFIFLKLILLLVVIVFFYFQFKKVNWANQAIYVENPFFLLLALLLVPVNWFFEWRKWTLTLAVVDIYTQPATKLNAFFAGIVTGMLTPNMLGNFIGRIYYFDRKHRIALVILTLVTNYAQFIASIFLGIVALLILNKSPWILDIAQLNWFFIFLAILFLLIYFNFEWVFKYIKRKTRMYLLIRNLQRRRVFRWKILGLSLLRHAVFTLQFSLMLSAFGEDFSFHTMLWIWQFYLWLTLAPSLFLGKLAIRESVAIWVLTAAGMGELTIVISSFLIWVFNLLLPTVIGLFIVKRQS
jgi:uncharacterized membrane protein YbhN (UPF0104 family)